MGGISNHRHQLFIAAYIEGPSKGNAAASAVAAGYQTKPNVQGARLLANASIAAEIARRQATIAAGVIKRGIAERQNRLDAQNARWQAWQQIVAERAAAYAGEAPGAGTGWLVRQYKQVGVGPHAQLVEEWALDTGLAESMRKLEQHTATETGDWVEKRAATDPSGAHAADDAAAALLGRIAGLIERSAAHGDPEQPESRGIAPAAE
jgi:hypothetical protein